MVDLITLNEAKEHLDKVSNADDAELLDFIEATTAVVEDYIGAVVSRPFTERQTGGGSLLILDHFPILSLTSVVPWLTFGTTYAVASLKVEKETGIVERLDGGIFTGGPFKVDGVAGRDTVSPNVRLAAKIIISHMWETQRPHVRTVLPRMDPPEQPVTSGMSYAVPRRALELLRSHLKPPVVA